MDDDGSTICLDAAGMRMTHTVLDMMLQQYVFPVQFILGVVGNSLNLTVLLSAGMRNRANDLLAAVSFADLFFLLIMLPHALAAFDTFVFNYSFRYVYLLSKKHLAAIANWSSAAAIWFILAVSIERFLVIRSPLRSRIYWTRNQMCILLLSLFSATGVLTAYHHFAYDCQLFHLCNGTQLYYPCYSAASDLQPSNPIMNLSSTLLADVSPLRRNYIRISTTANALLVVFIPIILVIILNILLIRQLKFRNETIRQQPKFTSSNTGGTGLSLSQQKQKRRVTVTVCAIASCFALTQGPSAVMAMWELAGGFSSVSIHFYTIFSITNSLVVTGKTINFLLFCLSSRHYRRKCIALLHRKFPRLSTSSSMARRSSCMLTTTTTTTSHRGDEQRRLSSRRQSSSSMNTQTAPSLVRTNSRPISRSIKKQHTLDDISEIAELKQPFINSSSSSN